MNGWTPTTPLKERLTNLIVQIPQEYRNRAVAECLTEDGNPHDLERALTSYVMRREWEFYPSPIDEAEPFKDGFCFEDDLVDTGLNDDRPYRSAKPFDDGLDDSIIGALP